MKNFLLKDENGRMQIAPVKMLEKPSLIKIVDHPIRIEIIKAIKEKTMYPAEIASKLKLHEQVVYYHVKQLLNADILSVVEKKEIRGTTAKRVAVKHVNFAVSLGEEWQDLASLSISSIDKKLESFLLNFAKGPDMLYVVGSPDPHGPFKARARDSHYAIDLANFLGKHLPKPEGFSVKLDVDINLAALDSNLVLVGGPATNLIVSTMNSRLPVKFSDGKPWEIMSEKTQKKYSEEAVGIVAKLPNPHFPNREIIVLAGISSPGTKAAVIALTRHYKNLLSTYTGQQKWAAVVHGFDLDGDGKVDSIEVLE